MKNLQEIKDEVVKEMGYENCDEVAKRYAEQAIDECLATARIECNYNYRDIDSYNAYAKSMLSVKSKLQ